MREEDCSLSKKKRKVIEQRIIYNNKERNKDERKFRTVRKKADMTF